MKYILYKNSNFYNIYGEKIITDFKYTKDIIDTYGFGLASLTDCSILNGFRLVSYKSTKVVPLQTTFSINYNNSFILIKYDFSSNDYITMGSEYKFIVSKDGETWHNHLNTNNYLVYNYKLEDNAFNFNNLDLIKTFDYINYNSKPQVKIKNNNYNYILLKLDKSINKLYSSKEMNDKWYIKKDNSNIVIKDGKVYIDGKLIYETTLFITKLGCDDVIIDTIKEF